MKNEEEKPLTFEEKLKCFVFTVENNEKTYLPHIIDFKIEREFAIAAANFIRQKLYEDK